MRAYLHYFNVLRLPLSRQLSLANDTLTVIAAEAAGAALDSLRTGLEAHQTRAYAALRLRSAWRQQQGRGTAAAVSSARAASDVDPGRLVELDNAVDNALSRLYRKWISDAEVFGADDPIGRAAARLASALFPEGLVAHIQVSQGEQYILNNTLLADLRSGAWDAELGLTSSASLVDRAEAAIRAFQAAWDADLRRRTAAAAITYEQVREAEQRCHEELVGFFVDAVSLLRADEDLLARVLGPFNRQQAELRAARRGRARPGSDELIDELDADEDAGPTEG